jgi:hypothetical protein
MTPAEAGYHWISLAADSPRPARLVQRRRAARMPGTKTAPAASDVLRVRVFELVDGHGQVRAQLNVEDSGEVVFRLRDADGTIRG